MGDVGSIEVDVTNIAHGGVSVARHDGRVVFVSDAIPGERVVARVTDDSKPSFWRADTVAVLEPSEHRREHVWAAAALDRDPADRAGGAEFGHIELGHQRELKRRVLADALGRMAGITTDVTVEPLPGDDERSGTGWRTRVRLQVDASGRTGPFAARSHRVIPVPDLPLATPELAAAAPLGRAVRGVDHVDVVSPSTGGARVIGAPRAIVEVVGGREFRLADRGFWQVHRSAAATLTTAVQEAIDGDRFDPSAANLDLYGGVGLLAAAVADRFGSDTRITSVESDPAATGYAAANLSEWASATAETGRVERWLRGRAPSAPSSSVPARSSALSPSAARSSGATVVLDPPRSGAGREVVDGIAALIPEQIVYVACDPVALARDVALFAGHGYGLSRLRSFDLFPNTHHLEAVATLTRV